MELKTLKHYTSVMVSCHISGFQAYDVCSDTQFHTIEVNEVHV